jgi:hypothetical protein
VWVGMDCQNESESRSALSTQALKLAHLLLGVELYPSARIEYQCYVALTSSTNFANVLSVARSIIGPCCNVSETLVDSTHPSDDKDRGVVIRLDLADLLGVLHELDGVLVPEEALAVVIGEHVHRDLVDRDLAALGRSGDDGEVFAEDIERVGGLGEVPPSRLAASVGWAKDRTALPT